MPEVSDEAIAREVRTLRTLRRRSGSGTGPGALPLDPDLPPPSPGSHEPYHAEASTSYSSDDDVTLAPATGGDSFWVPAHLHPELAPGEFRAFLKSHTSAHPEDEEVEQGEALGRSPSWLSRGDSRRGSDLGRKRSMLSRQYTPKAGDDVENERPPLPLRQRASIYGGSSGEKGLTLEDLQKLEMLVEEAADSDDPSAMTKLLKRNLSVNAQSGFLQDDIPVEGTGGAALPRPSSILRRSAHTKIRKAGLAGDGGGHRFAATRKGRITAAPVIDIPGLEDDDDGPASPSRRRPVTPSDDSEESGSSRRKASSSDSHEQTVESRRPSDGSTEETAIFDAYARNSRQSSVSNDSSSRSESPSPEPSPPRQNANLPPVLELPKSTSGNFEWQREEGEKTPTQESNADPLAGYRRPSPGEGFSESRPAAHLPPSLNLESSIEARVSPPDQTTPKASHQELPPGMAAPAGRLSTHGMPVQPQFSDRPSIARTDSAASSASSASKEKKGGLFSKKEKKGSKKDKDSFLGSLFGGNKKKQEEPVPVSNFSQAGPAAAAALLGASKSNKALTPGASPTSPSFNSFARYPIHVERAVYRLSHIKLANARRPLYEQVLISNLMFWYLGIIGRNVAEEKKANAEEEKALAKPPVSKGTPPRPIDSGSAGVALARTPEPPVPMSPTPAPGSGKKTGLTKPDRSRQAGRGAEAPVPTPSYGMQTAQVDNEVRSANMAMASMGLKGPPRPPSMLPPPHPQHQPHNQHPSTSPPLPHSPHRANSQPPPQQHRAMSPPGPPQTRPVSDYGAGSPKSQTPQNGPPPPQRGPPPAQPNFYGGQPPANGMSNSHSMSDVRDGRARTYSNPPQPPYPAQHSPGPNGQPPPPNMRRVVSEARPPAPSQHAPQHAPQHAGPQPGQIFRLPQAQAPPPPPSPYGPRQSLGSPPLAPAGRGYPGPPQRPPQPGPPGQQPPHGYRGPPGQPPTFANGARPSVPWEPPQRLPPGASPPPSGTVPYRPAQHMQHPQGQRSPPAGYDGRHHSPPLAGYPQTNGLPPGMQPSYSAHPQGPQVMRPPGPPRPGPGPGPGPGFNPYGQPGPGVQRQRSGDEGMYHRPAQAVPQGYGGHHR